MKIIKAILFLMLSLFVITACSSLSGSSGNTGTGEQTGGDETGGDETGGGETGGGETEEEGVVLTEEIKAAFTEKFLANFTVNGEGLTYNESDADSVEANVAYIFQILAEGVNALTVASTGTEAVFGNVALAGAYGKTVAYKLSVGENEGTSCSISSSSDLETLNPSETLLGCVLKYAIVELTPDFFVAAI